MMKRSLLISLALLPLTSCTFPWSTTPVENGEQTSSIAETKNVLYRGRLVPLGASIYMEGTHRLELEDGRFILLESNGVLLDDYLNLDVEVSGAVRPTVEGGGLIMRVEAISEISESSAMEEVSSSSSSSGTSVLSSSSSSLAPVVSSTAPVSRAAVSSAPVKSSVASSVATVSSSSTDDKLAAKTAVMAKANMDAAYWTQEYCSPVTLGFCFPVHKNWWYTSFGVTSSSLWHVEISSEELQALGDGPIAVVLLSGAASVPDGQVTVNGSTVVGVRAWSNNRHFEVRAPAALEKAVRYITQELKAAAGATQ